jgi:hypothetical protein
LKLARGATLPPLALCLVAAHERHLYGAGGDDGQTCLQPTRIELLLDASSVEPPTEKELQVLASPGRAKRQISRFLAKRKRP